MDYRTALQELGKNYDLRVLNQVEAGNNPWGWPYFIEEQVETGSMSLQKATNTALVCSLYYVDLANRLQRESLDEERFDLLCQYIDLSAKWLSDAKEYQKIQRSQQRAA